MMMQTKRGVSVESRSSPTTGVQGCTEHNKNDKHGKQAPAAACREMDLKCSSVQRGLQHPMSRLCRCAPGFTTSTIAFLTDSAPDMEGVWSHASIALSSISGSIGGMNSTIPTVPFESDMT